MTAMKFSLRKLTSRSFSPVVLLWAFAAGLVLCSCSQRIDSNKEERNAVKAGNKAYKSHQYDEAISDYDEAIEANPASEKAKYNLALATLMYQGADSVALDRAQNYLVELAKNASDPDVAENAIYTMANAAVHIGDELKRQSEVQGEDQGMAQQMSQKSTEYYRQAIAGYQELLRRKPGDLKVTQNLRVTQLKLPPEQDGGGGGNDNQNQDQNQDQQDQQNQNQQQQQQQQQPQPQADALNALEKREAQTRKRQVQPPAASARTDKPW